MNDRLYRSRDDRIVGGVCSGLADRFDLDPSLVRILWVVLTLLTGFVPGAVLYLVMLIVVPEEPLGDAAFGTSSPPGTEPAPWPATPPGENPPGAGPSQVDPGSQWTEGTAPGGQGPAPGAQSSWVPPAQAYADRRSRRAARRGRNDGAVALVFGVILILIGAWFLLREYLPSFDWDLLWPLVIIGLGVVLIVAAMGRRSPGGGDDAAS